MCFLSPQKADGQTHSSTLGLICSLHISGFSYSVLDLSLIWTLKIKLAATEYLMAFYFYTSSLKVYLLFFSARQGNY